ncbi:MAG: hypothetical protein ACYC49_06750, partial [Ignavibacteriaceae bacterium]
MEIQKFNRNHAFTSAINQLIVKEKNNDKLIKSIIEIAENIGTFNYACFGTWDKKYETIDDLNNHIKCILSGRNENNWLFKNYNLVANLFQKNNSQFIINDLQIDDMNSLNLDHSVAS